MLLPRLAAKPGVYQPPQPTSTSTGGLSRLAEAVGDGHEVFGGLEIAGEGLDQAIGVGVTPERSQR